MGVKQANEHTRTHCMPSSSLLSSRRHIERLASLCRPGVVAAAVLAAAALALGGCGGRDRGSAGGDSPESVTSAAPEAQARRIVEIRYPSVQAWVSEYAKRWGITPRVRWAAERRTDDRWIARVQITGGAGQQATGSWEVRAPLGPNPDPEQVRAAVENEVAPEPLDSGGRALSVDPGARTKLTAAERRGPVAIVGTVGLVDVDAGTVTIDASPEQSGAAASTDGAVRRGLELLRSAGEDAVTISIGNATEFTRSSGGRRRPSTLEAFAAGAVPPTGPSTFKWSIDGAQPRNLKALLDRPVNRVEWAAGP